MSEVLLRDDHQDNMFGRDEAVSAVLSVSDDSARASDASDVAVLAVLGESASVGDGTGGEGGLFVEDGGVAADGVFDRFAGCLFAGDVAGVSDGIFSPDFYVLSGEVRAWESWRVETGSGGGDWGRLSDAVSSGTAAEHGFGDALRVSDAGVLLWVSDADDAAAGSDVAAGAVSAAATMEDEAAVSDVLGLSSSVLGVVVSRGRASDGTASHLDALLEAEDAVEADGGCVRDAGARFEALAWTANTDNWAASRYLLDGWRGLAVVDGVLLGLSDEGVFVLDKVAGKGAEAVSASVCTGKVDIGQGVLAHPLGAYMEYALRGKAEMLVSTTQDGTVRTYPYRLVDGKTDELTNGRFVFGRGLRGRHFKFELRLSGASAHIHDWRIDAAAVKRRI